MNSRNTQSRILLLLCTSVFLSQSSIALAQSTQAPPRQATAYAKRTPAQYGFGNAQPVASGGTYVPQHLRHPANPTSGQIARVAYQQPELAGIEGQMIGQPNYQGQVISEPMIMDPIADPVYQDLGHYYDQGYGVEGDYEMLDDSIGSCDSGQCGECQDCLWHRIDGIFSNADFRLGVQGFKNSLNRDLDGSFGFHGGINLGLPLTKLSCGLFSGQFGINSVQSNFSGSSFTNESRNQLFVTGGIFRRVDQGLQGGVVYDYLQDDWYTNIGIAQLRGELSWVYATGNTFGFRFAHGLATDQTNTVLTDANGGQTVLSESWRANDQYRFFFRKLVAEGEGNIDFSIGYTEEDQTLIGLDFNTPVRGMMRFYGGFTYLLPEQRILAASNSEETWNVIMGMQFSPYRLRGYCRYNVPMFDVADNGSFQVFPNN